MSYYTAYSTLLNAVKSALLGLEDGGGARIFGDGAVCIAPCSNEAQLWLAMDAVGVLPCAVVFLGSAEFADCGLTRENTVAAALFGEFQAGTQEKAEGVFPLVDAVQNMFLPVAGAGLAAVIPTIGGAEFELRRITAIDSPERISAFVVELAASDAALTDI